MTSKLYWMLVLRLERAPPRLIGYCSSWALRIAPGVFVANLPSRVREEIWDHVVGYATSETRAVLVWSSREANEQGLQVRTLGAPRRRIVDREGLLISSWIPSDALEGEAEETPYLDDHARKAHPD